jgi:glutamine---fructose-6-phosphate transaminase (isomerizing)
MKPALFLADVERRPVVLHRVADDIDDGAMRWLLPAIVERVVLTGMGSSLYAATVAAQRLRGAGITAFAESASSELTPRLGNDDVVIGISAGGTSVETVRFLAACAPGHRIALTNDPTSPITAHALTVVPLLAQPETGGVACRSYTHTIIALLALEQQLTGQPSNLGRRVRDAADACDHLLASRDQWLDPVTEMLIGPHGTWLLAPVERVSSSLQGALMLREGPRRAAVGCETGDWSHVDVYLTKTLDYRALVFTGSRWDDQAAQWMNDRGSTVVAVGGQFPGARHVVRYPNDDDPIIALLAEVMIPELVAAHLWLATDTGA